MTGSGSTGSRILSSLGSDMQALSELERRRLSVQARLDGLKNTDERNELGQFATPPALAEEIVRLALTYRREEKAAIHFLDPGFGTGAFYSALLRSTGPSQVATAIGIEIDPDFAQAARDIWGNTGLSLIEADFTRLPPAAAGAKPNLIICNPPYIRHHHLEQEAKPILQEKAFRATGYKLNGLAGMYCYFLLIAHQWLQDDGLGVWLIPTEFMDVNYGETIRAYLAEKVSLIHVHRFAATDVQFADALVSSAVVIFRKSPPQLRHEVTFTIGGSPTLPDDTYRVSIEQLKRERKWTRVHKMPAVPNVTSYRDVFFGDLFESRRGIVTGANEFFVMERSEAEDRGLPHECYRPILPSPRYLHGNVITAAEDGYPHITPQLVLLDCDLREDQIQREFPSLWDYLENGKAQGLHQRYLTSRRNPWYRQEQRPHTPFLCTYMGRSQSDREPFKFIWNQSAATAPNVYLLLYPREPLAAYLSSSPERRAEVFELLMQITTDTLIGEGRTYGGGLHKIEPRELHRVPLNNIPLAQKIAAAMTLF